MCVREDILNPDNLVRNDLDARAVGLHKVDGLAARLREVNPDVDVKVRRIKLGGQESAASTDSALKQIGGCDLIMLDPDTPWQVDGDRMAALAGNTPFDKLPVQGRVRQMMKGGKVL